MLIRLSLTVFTRGKEKSIHVGREKNKLESQENLMMRILKFSEGRWRHGTESEWKDKNILL